MRYQLTPVAAAMPELHVAAEVRGSGFRIAGGVPGGRVSWLLSCKCRGVDGPIEVDKPADERGAYVQPALYGQPDSMSLAGRQLAAAEASRGRLPLADPGDASEPPG